MQNQLHGLNFLILRPRAYRRGWFLSISAIKASLKLGFNIHQTAWHIRHSQALLHRSCILRVDCLKLASSQSMPHEPSMKPSKYMKMTVIWLLTDLWQQTSHFVHYSIRINNQNPEKWGIRSFPAVIWCCSGDMGWAGLQTKAQCSCQSKQDNGTNAQHHPSHKPGP